MASPQQDVHIIYFVGQHLSHAVTNRIHDMVAKRLNIPWKVQAIDSGLLDDFLSKMHGTQFGGAVITIPHKIAVMPHLDRIDDISLLLGACNNVYKLPDGSFAGTNTDWIGVRDTLLQLASQASFIHLQPPVPQQSGNSIKGFGKAGLVFGSGGAARAAVYTLHKVFGASRIYVVNRDDGEVIALIKGIAQGYQRISSEGPAIIHLRSREEAESMDEVFYGIGTVPDFEATTPAEIQAFGTFEKALEKSRGVFLDMCYRPRLTRNLRLAREKGWNAGDGGQVVAWQLKAQWELWAGKEASDAIPLDEMLQSVHTIVEELA
jgi:quinate dehydrogenase